MNKPGLYAALGVAVVLAMLISSSDSSPPPILPGSIDRRRRVVEEAYKTLDEQPTREDVWSDVAPSLVGTKAAWCGGLVLRTLHRAGLALGRMWYTDGTGYISPAGLPTEPNPQPGDIAYYHQPYQHHATVVANNGDGTIDTVDGNQGTPGVKLKQRRPLREASVYYSIEPFVREVS